MEGVALHVTNPLPWAATGVGAGDNHLSIYPKPEDDPFATVAIAHFQPATFIILAENREGGLSRV